MTFYPFRNDANEYSAVNGVTSVASLVNREWGKFTTTVVRSFCGTAFATINVNGPTTSAIANLRLTTSSNTKRGYKTLYAAEDSVSIVIDDGASGPFYIYEG